jgi:hypothetical protein
MGEACRSDRRAHKYTSFGFRRTRRRWEDNITRDLREIVWWTECVWFRIGAVAGSCEHGTEPSGSIKGGEFFLLPE